jgi:hypothetical protein
MSQNTAQNIVKNPGISSDRQSFGISENGSRQTHQQLAYLKNKLARLDLQLTRSDTTRSAEPVEAKSLETKSSAAGFKISGRANDTVVR